MWETLTLIVGIGVIFVVLSLYWQYQSYINTNSLLYKLKALEKTVLEQQEKILSFIADDNKTEKKTETKSQATTVENTLLSPELDKSIITSTPIKDNAYSDSHKSPIHHDVQSAKLEQTIYPTSVPIEQLASNELKDEFKNEQKETDDYQHALAAVEEKTFDKVSPNEAIKEISSQPIAENKQAVPKEVIITSQSAAAKEDTSQYTPKTLTSRFSRHYKKEQVLSPQQQMSQREASDVEVSQNTTTVTMENIKSPVNLNHGNRDKVSVKKQQKSITELIWQWVITGNPLAKIGMLLLFFGLSYLLKYSIENELISASTRLMMAGGGCLALLGIGWWLRKKNLIYALILQGGGIGGLYITIFAATKIYDFIPIGFALGIMVFICLVSVALAVIHRAISLAILASLGGYLAPVLLSTGSGNYVALFSYYLILSIGILIISHWQVWRLLNLIGFTFTFGIGVMWAIPNYSHADYLPCQLFLIANWFIFGVATELSTLKNKLKLNIPFDATLLFGTPLVGFIFQHKLASAWPYGIAIASSLYALAYFALTWFTLKRYREEGKLLSIAFFMLSATFATLAVPFAFSAEWTSIVWSIEGVMILAFSVLQQQKKPAFAGTALIAISFVILLNMRIYQFSEWIMLILQVVVIFAAAILWFRAQFTKIDNKTVGFTVLFIGAISWIYSLLLLVENGQYWLIPHVNLLAFALIIISCWAMFFAGKKSQFFELASCSVLLWPTSALLMLVYLSKADPLIDGWLSCILWIAMFASGFYLLKLNTLLPNQRLNKQIIHGLHLGFIGLFLLTEMLWLIRTYYLLISLHFTVAIFVTSLFIVLSYILSTKITWSKPYQDVYQAMTTPILGLLVLLLVMANLNSGNTLGMKFIPLLNLMDIMGIIGLWITYKFIGQLKQQPKYEEIFQTYQHVIAYFIPFAVFWWANGILLRGLVFATDIEWNYYLILNSKVIQTVLAIIWTITALVMMVTATRKKLRSQWFVGGVLLAVVIAKLFLIDITLGSGLLRALAFIGVALLILLIGYFSPLPPKRQLDNINTQK
ncbi:MAG TPA: hypothetical protein DEV59_11890 [Proteus sp.]|nr:hypothetical protein [Proteus sp. (in: enterobacteria)]